MTGTELYALQTQLNGLLQLNADNKQAQEVQAFLQKLNDYLIDDQDNVITLLKQTTLKKHSHLGIRIALYLDGDTTQRYLRLLFSLHNAGASQAVTEILELCTKSNWHLGHAIACYQTIQDQSSETVELYLELLIALLSVNNTAIVNTIINLLNQHTLNFGHLVAEKSNAATALYLKVLALLTAKSDVSYRVSGLLAQPDKAGALLGQIIAYNRNDLITKQYLDLLIELAQNYQQYLPIAATLTPDINGWHLGNIVAYYQSIACHERYVTLLEILAPHTPLEVFDIWMKEISCTIDDDLKQKIEAQHQKKELMNTVAILRHKGCGTDGFQQLLTRQNRLLEQVLSTDPSLCTNEVGVALETNNRIQYKPQVKAYLVSLSDNQETLQLLRNVDKPKTLLAQFCDTSTGLGFKIWRHNYRHPQEQSTSTLKLTVVNKIKKIEAQTENNKGASVAIPSSSTNTAVPSLTPMGQPLSDHGDKALATAQSVSSEIKQLPQTSSFGNERL